MIKLKGHVFKFLKATGLIRILKMHARKVGFTFVDSNSVSRVYDFVNLTKSRGIKLDVIYDIGANEGQWTRERQANCPFELTFFLFEPNAFHNENLKSTIFQRNSLRLCRDGKFLLIEWYRRFNIQRNLREV